MFPAELSNVRCQANAAHDFATEWGGASAFWFCGHRVNLKRQRLSFGPSSRLGSIGLAYFVRPSPLFVALSYQMLLGSPSLSDVAS